MEKKENATIIAMLERVDAKLDILVAALAEGRNTIVGEAEMLTGFTTKQHVVLQMLLRGASNAEIAKRLGVTENTAKVHVRTITKKLGVSSRSQIVVGMMNHFLMVDAEVYELLSGGLPKDWDENYSEPDKYAGLYLR